MASAKLVRAVSNFACEADGVERLVHAGEVLRANDPVVRKRPELFEETTPIEQTTAAPGERRRR